MPGRLRLPSGAVHYRLFRNELLSSEKCIWRVQTDLFVSSWQVFILKNIPAYLASWTSLWETKIVNMRKEIQIGKVKVKKKWSCEIWNGNIHTSSWVKQGGFLSPRKELEALTLPTAMSNLLPRCQLHNAIPHWRRSGLREKWLMPRLQQRKNKVGLGGLMSKRKEVLKWGHVQRSGGSAGRSPSLAQCGTVTLLVIECNLE